MSIVTTTLPLDPSYTGASLRIQYYEYDSVNDERDAVGSPVSDGIFELVGGEGLFVLALDIPDALEMGWADVYVNGAPGVILASIPIGADEDMQAVVVAALEEYDAATGADVDAIADDIEALGTSASINLLNVVDGGVIRVYRGDTWHFQLTVPLVLTDYEDLAFVVKHSENDPDADAILLVRKVGGLIRIAGAAPTGGSTAGSFTVDDATHFTVHVNITETSAVEPAKSLKWWLKVFETGTTPDEGYTRATGTFIVANYGLRAIV